MTPRRVFAVAATALIGLAAAYVAIGPRLATQAYAGPGIFDNPEAFSAYVDGLRLHALDVERAGERLRAEGFECHVLAPGNTSCERRIRGSNCAERQFVDLNEQGAGRLQVATRFGLGCS